MSFVTTVPYASLGYAKSYVGERLDTTTWDNADDETRKKALKMATRFINQLDFVGLKTDFDQVNEFPRLGNTDIPDEVCQACVELALAFLDGRTLDRLQETSGIASLSVGDASTSFTGAGRSQILGENLGMPSPVAARLLSPWLHRPDSFELTRVG